MLISEQYAKEQERLHSTGSYGVMGGQYGEVVSGLVEMTEAKTLLDYGCGSQRSLTKTLNCDVVYQGYDPGYPPFSKDPDPADLVCCIDVLEHIEPECLDSVLEHLASKCLKFAFITIHTGPALKTLSDGRNAHLIQKDESFWLPKLFPYFRIIKLQANKRGFDILLKRL